MTTESAAAQFFTAIIMDDLAAVRDIAAQNKDFLSWVSPAGYPPLHMAILNKREDITTFLVERGADPSTVAVGMTASVMASAKGMLGAVEKGIQNREQVRTDAIDACGDQMRTGLNSDLRLSRPLTLKLPKP